MSIPPLIFKKLAANERLTSNEIRSCLNTILKGKAKSEQISAWLLGLEAIGISELELAAGVTEMREHMKAVSFDYNVIDIVGTGGTGLHTLSISTATAIVCAGAGAKIAKHGNRAASSLSGTADTLSELGVGLTIKPETAIACVDIANIGFLYAPNHHPAMRHVGPARKALGIRTFFNLLGPMCNPASAEYMLLGVSDDRYRQPMAKALQQSGVKHAWVVHGSDGLDEITTTGPTYVSEVKDGKVTEFTIAPESYGIELTTIESLRGGHPAENALALRGLLNGEEGDYRNIVRLNSGAALMLAGLANDIPSGIDMATESIDSGKAKAALETLIEVSNG